MPDLSRRSVLGLGAAGVAAGTAWWVDRALAAGGTPPVRTAARLPATLPAVQHDVDAYTAPAQLVDGVAFRFGPAYTLFTTVRLTRTPTRTDQQQLAAALEHLEASVPFAAAGVMAALGYGMPYWDRLPSRLVSAHLPRLATGNQPAFAEATPMPTDVVPGGTVTKLRYQQPVSIEANDAVLVLRGDRVAALSAAGEFLLGSGRLAGRRAGLHSLFTVTSTRLIMNVPGLPRALADAAGLPYAGRIHPRSPLWMGFSDHQVGASASAEATTFLGRPGDHRTSASPGDYLALGSVLHLSHVLLDLEQYYLPHPDSPQDAGASYLQRVQYMFHADDPPARGNADQFTDGGGPAYLPNAFRGPDAALRSATGTGVPDGRPRLGHIATLQRASRAADGTPLHIRVDGAGFDTLDSPGGDRLPKLHFGMYVPTAQTFTDIRRAGASLDLVRRFGVRPNDNGLERFCTATRRQNFLSPPRAHRAFPLLELA